jgi:hypothetical protein
MDLISGVLEKNQKIRNKMKIKIGDKIYDADKEPVMLIFESDMQRITVGQHLLNMPEGARKYCMFPDEMDQEIIKEFMKVD